MEQTRQREFASALLVDSADDGVLKMSQDKVSAIQVPATKKRFGKNPFTGQEQWFAAKPASVKVKGSPVEEAEGRRSLRYTAAGTKDVLPVPTHPCVGDQRLRAARKYLFCDLEQSGFEDQRLEALLAIPYLAVCQRVWFPALYYIRSVSQVSPTVRTLRSRCDLFQ